MENINNYYAILIFQLLSLVTLSSVIITGISYRENRSSMSLYTFFMAQTLLLLVLFLNVGFTAYTLNITEQQPIRSIVIVVLALANIYSTTVPPLFVFEFFKEKIPDSIKLLIIFLLTHSVTTHALFLFDKIDKEYFNFWSLLMPAVSFSVTTVFGIRFYGREKNRKRQIFIGKLLIFSLILFPIYLLDGFMSHNAREDMMRYLWLIRPLFYAFISLYLIQFSYKMDELFPETKIAEDRSFSESYDLTEREKDVLNLVIKGFRNREMAGILDLKEKSVENYLSKIYRKCDVTSRVELMHTVMIHNGHKS